MPKAILLVHAGAGQVPENIPKEAEADSHEALKRSLQAGYKILNSGGDSVHAAEAAIKILEDFPLFNAGKGAVISSSGQCQLDASIMEGKSLKAGAVAGITIAKNPISVACAVMQKTEYVLLAGAGANEFTQFCQLDIVDPAYFFTPQTLEKLKVAKQKEAEKNKNKLSQEKCTDANADTKFGTVGAVALDKQGNLAAGTSTGGRTNKQFDRIGDSAIIGAGTYADNDTCAVSCTGWGEIFIRHVVAHNVSALMQYKGLTVEEAVNKIIHDELPKDSGGIIALDNDGNYSMPYNTAGMLRGFITQTGECHTYIYE